MWRPNYVPKSKHDKWEFPFIYKGEGACLQCGVPIISVSQTHEEWKFPFIYKGEGQSVYSTMYRCVQYLHSIQYCTVTQCNVHSIVLTTIQDYIVLQYYIPLQYDIVLQPLAFVGFRWLLYGSAGFCRPHLASLCLFSNTVPFSQCAHFVSSASRLKGFALFSFFVMCGFRLQRLQA